jgi:predicted  nucleic acid-binding Zn-ribbon protein
VNHEIVINRLNNKIAQLESQVQRLTASKNVAEREQEIILRANHYFYEIWDKDIKTIKALREKVLILKEEKQNLIHGMNGSH